jgi:hypothetical protein
MLQDRSRASRSSLIRATVWCLTRHDSPAHFLGSVDSMVRHKASQ